MADPGINNPNNLDEEGRPRPDWYPTEDEISAMLREMANETWREYRAGSGADA